MSSLQAFRPPVCPECDGAGRIPDPFDNRPAADAIRCPVCNDNAPPARDVADVGQLVRAIEQKIASVAKEEASETSEYGRGVYRGSNLTLQWFLTIIRDCTVLAGSNSTPEVLDALCQGFAAAAVRADNDAENHGAQWQRDRTAGVAQGLRQAVDMLHDMFGPPPDLADVLSMGDPADEPPTDDEC